ncbi:hypothetical protein ACT3R5_15950 [Glutamicibacter sp. AOP5-A2-7]
MQAGGVATREVYSISGRVLVNGTDIGADVKSVSVGRDIPDGLPGSSAAFQAATATVVADMSALVSSRTQHPWNRSGIWPPSPANTVEIWLSDGANEWRQIKGSVEEPSGDADSAQVTFTVVDRYSALRRTVNLPALSDAMPALTDANEYRYIGLQSTYVTDAVLRQAGRYATPSMSGGCFISVPLQGSTWPERGEVRTSIKLLADESGQAYPNWFVSPYGLKVHNLEATYTPFVWSGEDTVFDQPMELTQEIVDGLGGSTFLYVTFGLGSLVLAMSNTQVFARYYPSSGAYVNLVQVSKSGIDRVTARFSRSGSTLTAEIRTRSTGGVVSEPVSGTTTLLAGDLAGPVSLIRATGPGAQGAFQAAYPATAWSRIGQSASAVLHVAAAGRNSLVGLPAQINAEATDLLAQQADAEFASWWIDENDVLQWWDRGVLVGQPSAATLTAADHVKSIPWTHGHGSLRREVSVDYRVPTVTQKWRTDLTLWEGSGETYNQGELDDLFVNVPDDEIWLGVDYQNPTRYSADTPNYYVINRGIRTVIGGIAIDNNGDERTTNSVQPGVRRVTDNAYAFSVQIALLGADEQAALQFPQEYLTDTALWSRWRGKNLPILRGKKKLAFQDDRAIASLSGPAMVQDFVHDVGWWIQNQSYAQSTADYAAAIVTVDQPLIDGIEIMPVFNLQVGDVITVSDPEVMGLTIKALVTSNNVDADFTAGSASQSLGLRPLTVTNNGATWEQWGAVMDSRTWRTFGSEQAGNTWQDWGSAPLLGEDTVNG